MYPTCVHGTPSSTRRPSRFGTRRCVRETVVPRFKRDFFTSTKLPTVAFSSSVAFIRKCANGPTEQCEAISESTMIEWSFTTTSSPSRELLMRVPERITQPAPITDVPSIVTSGWIIESRPICASGLI